MFTMPSRENPLATLLAGGISSAASQHIAAQKKAEGLKKVEEATKGLGPNSTPFEWINAISQVPEEYRDPLMKLNEQVFKAGESAKERENKLEIEGAKRVIADRKTPQEEDLEQQQIQTLAKEYGLDPEQLKGLNASQVGALGRNLNPVGSRPVSQPELQAINQVTNSPEWEDMTETQRQTALLNAGVSPKIAQQYGEMTASERSRRQKDLEESFKRQKDFIDHTTDQYRTWESETKPKLLQLQQIGSDEELMTPTQASIFEHFGIPLALTGNPSNELFEKVSIDLLKGLPDSYGSRILKVEVDNFLRTIPGLKNSATGRRMIASNLLKIGQMKEVFYKAMRSAEKQYISNGKPLPIDFEQEVLDQVMPQLDRLKDDFVRIGTLKEVPDGTVPYFGPDNEIVFVKKNKDAIEWADKNGGRRIW